MSTRWSRSVFVYLIVIGAVIAIFLFWMSSASSQEIPVSQVVNMAKEGQLRSIDIQGDSLTAVTINGDTFESRKEDGSSLLELLDLAGVNPNGSDSVQVTVKGSGGLGSLFGIFLNLLPLLFFGAILLFMMRQAQGSGNQTLSFGRSKARLLIANRPQVSFSDVAGAEEAKQEMSEVVEFLREPERFAALGARIPRGVLLVGPPGTGKTLLARAVAGEAGVPFFSISGSEFVEMFVGVGAARVRDLFDQAKRNAPCIVFVDEIDAVGRHRGAGLGGGHDEREQTLNQILVEMDGFDTNTNVIVVAATNRPDILDPALLRPGRFDRRVVLDHPDIQGRKEILNVHSKGKPLDPTVEMETIARQTPGFTGSDLANLVNEAAILAARETRKTITHPDFAEAIDRIIAGPERKSRIINEHEKKLVAFHEAGHALVGKTVSHGDKVHKISIMARANMGGYTRYLPTEERYMWTKEQFEDKLATAMGGRVAEELVFGEITTGASNDLEQVTQIARSMVTRYGMSEKLGPRTFGRREEMIFLGREITEQRDYSDKVAEVIDDEVHRMVDHAYEAAKEILSTHLLKLTQIAEYLIEHESVEGPELENLFESQVPVPEAEGLQATPPVLGQKPQPVEGKRPRAAVRKPRAPVAKPRPAVS